MSNNQSVQPNRNIVLCSDGTGNRGGVGHGTNIWRIFKSVDRHGHKENSLKTEQIAFYDDGVGTEDFKLLKMVGGVFGFGMSRNIRQLYIHLVRAYKPGDDIYLFGFSRGAYTVRVLANMICRCGVLNYEKIDSIETLIERVESLQKLHLKISRADDNEKESLEKELADMHDKWCYDIPESHAIKFIGAWDTVHAVGLPFKSVRDGLNNIFKFGFSNSVLNDKVEKACHALAVDDQRLSFHPEMWDEKNESINIEQVWFSGVHANVGGGYPKDSMSLLSLDWMMGKAEEMGLRFQEGKRDEYRQDANAHTKLYDSRSGLGAYYRYKPRDIGDICQKFNIGTPKIHISVLERINQVTSNYGPLNLPNKIEVVGTDQQQSLAHESDLELTRLTHHINENSAQRTRIQNEADKTIKKRIQLYWLFFTASVVLAWAIGIDNVVYSAVFGEWKGILGWAGENKLMAIISAAILTGLFLYRKSLVEKLNEFGIEAWKTLIPMPDIAPKSQKPLSKQETEDA